MTSAQLILAKTGQAPAWIFSRPDEERNGWVGAEEGEEVVNGEARVRRGWMDSLARASITRAKTYITIWCHVSASASWLVEAELSNYLLVHTPLSASAKDCIST